MPILRDIAPGVPGAWRSPVVELVLGLSFIAACLSVAGVSLFWLCLIAIAMMVRILWPLYMGLRIMGKRKGMVLWLLGMAYGSVAMGAGLPVIIWFFWAIARVLDSLAPGVGGDNPILEKYGTLWPHILLIGSLLLLLAKFCMGKAVHSEALPGMLS